MEAASRSETIRAKINRYKEFWDRKNSTALLGFSVGSYFPSERYAAARRFLKTKQKIEAEMINVQEFIPDYLKMFDQWNRIDHDIFFTAAPFTGMPWLEAMLGCDVFSTESSFVAHTINRDIDRIDLGSIRLPDWSEKYIEFICTLQDTGEGIFPVGQPILRGPADIVGTFLGHEELVLALFDHPEVVVKLLNQSAQRYLDLICDQQKYLRPFWDGYAMGFYDLWCPGPCLWFQDDLTALLSPKFYEKYIYEIHRMLSANAPYTMMHLHPSSFYILDYLLDIETLKAIQINKDIGGPTVEEMMPWLQKVQAKKNLVLCGDFSPQEFAYLTNSLQPEGLYILVWNEDVSVQAAEYRVSDGK